MNNKLQYIFMRGSELGFSSRHLIQYFNKDIPELSSYFLISPENKMLHVVYGIENAVKFNYFGRFETKDFPRRYHNEFIIRLDDDLESVNYFKSYVYANVTLARDDEKEKLDEMVDILYHAMETNVDVISVYSNNNLFTILEENDKLVFGERPLIKLKYNKVAKLENFKTDKEFKMIDKNLILDAFYLNETIDNTANRYLVAVGLTKEEKEIVLLRVYKFVSNRDDLLVSFYNEILNTKGIYASLTLRDEFDLDLLKEINNLFDVKVSINQNILEIDKVVKAFEGSEAFDKLS